MTVHRMSRRNNVRPPALALLEQELAWSGGLVPENAEFGAQGAAAFDLTMPGERYVKS